MRGVVSVAVPVDATAGQLAALASLLSAIEAGRWAHLAASFDRLDEREARWPEAMGEVLDRLAGELRRAAADRAEVATVDGPVAHG